MKTIVKVLIFVLAATVLGGAAVFFTLRQNLPVVEAPAEVDNGGEQLPDDESYCNQYAPEDCPQNCVVCPPCEVCSSIQCRAQESCVAMGFGKDWYKENVTPIQPSVNNGDNNGKLINGNAGIDINDNQELNIGMANSASVYCVGQGGKLEIREGEGGQYGVCVMPDGTECDEWEFFRTKVCGGASMDNGDADDQVCGRENCHGLDIKCGLNVAEMCTMEYQLGDKCLRYVNCGVINGECQQIPSAAFETCKECAQKCQIDFANDPMKMFDCESNCE